MQLRAELVHAEPGIRVVQLSAWRNGECLGSTLAEAATVEQAEQQAELRLRQRLASEAPAPSRTTAPVRRGGAPDLDANLQPARSSLTAAESGARQRPVSDAPSRMAAATVNRELEGLPLGTAGRQPASEERGGPLAGSNGAADGGGETRPRPTTDPSPPVLSAGSSGPTPAKATPAERINAERPESDERREASGSAPAEPPPLDPEDWSDELAQIELQLQRLGWQREQEGLYLERAFGHASRSRITTYSDLLAYSQALASFAVGSDPATVAIPLRRRDLLDQCDQLLTQLAWTAAQGRASLERHFQLSSRRQLNDEQLLHFNMLLESELIQRDQSGH